LKSLLPALAASLFSCCSWAALGGAPANLGAHAGPERSSTASTGITTYTVLQKQLDSGTTVHEFVDASGTVFAVSWSGPFLPDLKEILGDHFDAMLAQAAKGQRGQRSQLTLRRSDVVIVTAGHMGALEGRAWLPAKLPAGFDPNNAKWPQ